MLVGRSGAGGQGFRGFGVSGSGSGSGQNWGRRGRNIAWCGKSDHLGVWVEAQLWKWLVVGGCGWEEQSMSCVPCGHSCKPDEAGGESCMPCQHGPPHTCRVGCAPLQRDHTMTTRGAASRRATPAPGRRLAFAGGRGRCSDVRAELLPQRACSASGGPGGLEGLQPLSLSKLAGGAGKAQQRLPFEVSKPTVVPRCPKVTPSFCLTSLAEPRASACLGRHRPNTGPTQRQCPSEGLFVPRRSPKTPRDTCSQRQSKNHETSHPRDVRHETPSKACHTISTHPSPTQETMSPCLQPSPPWPPPNAGPRSLQFPWRGSSWVLPAL